MNSPRYAFGPFVLDPTRRLLLRHGTEVTLTPKAFDLLRVLVESRGEVVSKEQLLEAIWPDTVVEESNLSFQVSTLRKVLGEKRAGSRYVGTIPGRGYQFVAPVEIIVATEVLIEETSRETVEIEETGWRLGRKQTLLILLVLGALAALSSWIMRSRPVAPPRKDQVIAVLPFKPIVPGDRDEALEIGMADAMIARISAVDGLIVRPLTAVRRYASVDSDAIEAGRALGAHAVLDGSIHRSGDQIRVTARLLRVSDSKQLWAGSFDDRFSGIFAVHDSISRRIAAALALNLTSEQERRMRSLETVNMDAYREYATGRLYATRLRAGDMHRAIPHFERAIELDPDYATAWAGLAQAYASLPISADERPRDWFGRAKQAAQRALALDPESGEAHAALARTHFWFDWDWTAAEVECRKAIELDSRNAFHRIGLAHLLSNIGRHEESRLQAAEARRLEPLSPIVNTLSGQFLLQAGDVGSGTRVLQETLQLDPDYWIARLNLGKAYEMQGRHEEALVEFRRALALSGPNLEPLMMIGYLQGVIGETEEATAVADRMVEAAGKGYVPPTKIALVYVGLGDRDRTFEWLDRACEERDLGLTFLWANPRWRQLEGDPRFERIRLCVNLPEWR